MHDERWAEARRADSLSAEVAALRQRVEDLEDACRIGERTCAELVAERDALRDRLAQAMRELEKACESATDAEAERDALLKRLEVESVDLDMLEELRTLRGEVERLRALSEGSVGWRTAQEQQTRAERAEAALRHVLYRNHPESQGCSACADARAALAPAEEGK
jgi:chromosome segregation ATPase